MRQHIFGTFAGCQVHKRSLGQTLQEPSYSGKPAAHATESALCLPRLSCMDGLRCVMLVEAAAYAGAGCVAVIAGVRALLRGTEADPLFVAASVSVVVLNTTWHRVG
jgi:hypothetical protein